MNNTAKKTMILTLLITILISPSMVIFANAVNPPPNWDVTGNYVIDLLVDGHPTHYTEYLVLEQDLTGTITGVSLALAGPTSVWDIDTGSVSGDTINFYGHYQTNPTMKIHFWGDIASDGSIINGKWEDLPRSLGRTGTWQTTKGFASPIVFQLLNLPEGTTATIEIIEVGDLPDCIPPLPDGLITTTPYINVEITEGNLEGSVTVAYYYDADALTIQQERKLRLYMSGHCVDFNCDGTINGQDLTIIKKGIKNGETETETPCGKSLTFDLNNDEEYDNLDLNIVKDFMTKGLIVNQLDGEGRSQVRLPWMDITTDIDTELNIIYGETDYFSIFRGR